MPDLFEDMADTGDEFALPGDDAVIAALPEVDADGAVVEQPRDEIGRFAKADAEVEPEAGAEEPEAPTGETQAEATERLLAGKFKTQDDLERAYEELSSRFGQQGNEIGELRRAFDQRLEQIDQRLATPQVAPVAITADLIERNPEQAAELAYAQNDEATLGHVLAQWSEFERGEARAWVAEKRAAEQIAQLKQAADQRYAELESRLAPAAQVAEQAQLSTLVGQAAAANPGLAEFVQGDRISDVAAEFPEVGQMLALGTPEQRVRAITTLHQIHRGRESDNLKVSQQEVARATADQAQQAREEAFVASATTSSTGVKPSRAEEIAADWEAERAPLEAGWNV